MVGVPLIATLAVWLAPILSPGGSAPTEMVHVWRPVPFSERTVAAYTALAVPAGSEGVTIARGRGASSIWTVKLRDAVAFDAEVTRTSKVNMPDIVGVPESEVPGVPDAASVRPGGSVPEASAHWYAPSPPS